MSRIRSLIFVALIVGGLIYLSIAQAQLPTPPRTQYLAIVFGQPPSPTPTSTPLLSPTPSPTPLPPALERYALSVDDLPDGYTFSEEKSVQTSGIHLLLCSHPPEHLLPLASERGPTIASYQ